MLHMDDKSVMDTSEWHTHILYGKDVLYISVNGLAEIQFCQMIEINIKDIDICVK